MLLFGGGWLCFCCLPDSVSHYIRWLWLTQSVFATTMHSHKLDSNYNRRNKSKNRICKKKWANNMFCISHHCCYLKTSVCSWVCMFQNIEFVLFLWLDSDVITVFAAGSIFIYLLFFWMISRLSLNIEFIIFVGFYSSSLFVCGCCFIFNVYTTRKKSQTTTTIAEPCSPSVSVAFHVFIFFFSCSVLWDWVYVC